MVEFITKLLLTIVSYRIVSAKMEGKIVGGDYAKIEDYPHSAFLSTTCSTKAGLKAWSCGASILNQKIVLSAAHCFEECPKQANVLVIVGNADRERGLSFLAEKYKMHEEYNTVTIENDISLVFLRNNLPLGDKVKRVILMKNPPYQETAMVAGWGMTNEINPTSTTILKCLKQKVVPRNSCIQRLGQIPVGTICASEPNSNNQYASGGDSGSALVVRSMIQIGLVSFKKTMRSRSLVVYTDTGYFYPWIVKTANKLYCGLKF